MTRIRNTVSLILISSAVFLILLALLLRGLQASSPTSRLVYIAYDTCGFEVAKGINRYYPEIQGPVLLPSGVESISAQLVIHLGVNTSMILGQQIVLNESSSMYSDALKPGGLIKSEDMWTYCLYGDTDALSRIANAIVKYTREQSSKYFSLPIDPTLLLVSAAILGSTGLTMRVWDEIEERIKRIRRILPIITPILLRQKITSEEALSHPLRAEIYRIIRSNGVILLTDLLNLGPRAVVEWHLYVLMRSGLVAEVRIGRGRRRRRYICISDPDVVLKRLSEVDSRVKCIVENISKTLSPVKLAEICDLDVASVNTILRLRKSILEYPLDSEVNNNEDINNQNIYK